MRRPISRRDFIKGTAAAAVSGLLVGCSDFPPIGGGSSSGGSNSGAGNKPDSGTSTGGDDKKSPWRYTVQSYAYKTAVLTGYDASLLNMPNGVLTLPSEVDHYKIV